MNQSNKKVNSTRSHRNRLRGACVLVFCMSTTFIQSLAQPQAVLESDLRAAVIVGILRFTQWDQQAPGALPADEITVCAWGNPPSVRGLERSSNPIRVRDQLLRLQRLTLRDDLLSCPVVIWGGESATAKQIQFSPDSFIICDNCNLDSVTAVINLVRDDNRIQFDVNLNHARSAGIRFSSNLLDLARHVEGI
jgi:hypothetical protein